MRAHFAAIAVAILLGIVPRLCAAGPFFLKGGETVLFFGDSITQNGGYVNDFEAYLLTRFPAKTFRVINHGISSETISGTTEEDHDPPRPSAHPRFSRDVAAWKPDVVISCFGMNDGNYYPFGAARFQKFKQGYLRLIDRIRAETNARLILLTPPPFDPYRRRVIDPDAKTFGYKFPALDYDDTLTEYSRWLITLRKPGQVVVDLHGKLNDHLRRRREEKVSFHLSPDAVHPNTTGHWLMAQQLLRELGAPAVVAEAAIDATTPEVLRGKITELKVRGADIAFTWNTPLPMPLNPSCDAGSVKMERFALRLNRHRLTINGTKAVQFDVFADEKRVGAVSAIELTGGVDLLRMADFPTNRLSRELLELVKVRRSLVYRSWRKEIGRPLLRTGETAEISAVRRRVDDLNRQIEKLRQPRQVRIRLRPVEGP